MARPEQDFATAYGRQYGEHLTLGRAVVEPCWQRRMMSAMCRWHLQLSVRDRGLRRKLTPDYHAMCKRQILAGRYYQAMQKPGVHLVTEAIDHVEPAGIVTADGTLHELDLLVMATGFDARAYVRPMEIVGKNGVTLDEAWEDGPHAYRSVAVPGFPNMFMLMGPHSPIGNQSLVLIAEDQADYAMWWINKIRDGRVVSAVTDRRGNQGIQRADESRNAADDLDDRMQELVPRQGRSARIVSLGAASPPRVAELTRVRTISTSEPPECDGRHTIGSSDPCHTSWSLSGPSEPYVPDNCTRV